MRFRISKPLPKPQDSLAVSTHDYETNSGLRVEHR